MITVVKSTPPSREVLVNLCLRLLGLQPTYRDTTIAIDAQSDAIDLCITIRTTQEQAITALRSVR
jgi:hypothetical protein